MTSNNNGIIKSAIVSISFVSLSFFYYYIDRFSPLWCTMLATLMIAVMFIMVIVNIFQQALQIIKNRGSLTTIQFLPLLIYFACLLAPVGSAESFESKIWLSACYEGTQSQAIIKFRTDHTFEIHSTGVFFYNRWCNGKWKQNGKILLLEYDKQPMKMLGQKLLIDANYLKPLDTSVPEEYRKHPVFSFGFCRGKN